MNYKIEIIRTLEILKNMVLEPHKELSWEIQMVVKHQDPETINQVLLIKEMLLDSDSVLEEEQ